MGSELGSQPSVDSGPEAARPNRGALRVHQGHHSFVGRGSQEKGLAVERTWNVIEKLFEVSTASKSQILMTVFMFWMFGNNISIFILFPIIQTLTTAVGGILNMQKGSCGCS